MAVLTNTILNNWVSIRIALTFTDEWISIFVQYLATWRAFLSLNIFFFNGTSNGNGDFVFLNYYKPYTEGKNCDKRQYY